MEPEGSLPQSQVPANSPYPEPVRYSLCPTSHLKIHLNIILLSTPDSPKWSFSLRFRHQNSVYNSPLPHTCYMPRPAHYPRFFTRKIFSEWYRSLSSSMCSFLHSPVTLSLLGPNILLSTLFSNTLCLCSSLNVRDQLSQPYKTNGEIVQGDQKVKNMCQSSAS